MIKDMNDNNTLQERYNELDVSFNSVVSEINDLINEMRQKAPSSYLDEIEEISKSETAVARDYYSYIHGRKHIHSMMLQLFDSIVNAMVGYRDKAKLLNNRIDREIASNSLKKD